MESRKVQKVGYSTMIVSLPSKWVKKHNIHASDLVFVTEELDGTLKIIPSQIAKKEEMEELIINADGCSERGILERIIVGSYILGYDIIKITSSERIRKDQTDEVRRIVRKLIGLGILEETEKNILLQCSIDPKKFKIDTLFRRLAVIALTILSEAMQAFLENNKVLAEEAIKREDEADMIYYLAVRLLLYIQTKPETMEETGKKDTLIEGNRLRFPSIRLMLQYLELVADYSEDIAKAVIGFRNYRDRTPKSVVEEIYHISESTQNILRKAVECIFIRDIKVANELLEIRNELKTESDRIMQDAPEIPYLRAIISCLNKIADKGAEIVNIAMNRALEEPEKYGKDIIKKIKYTSR